MKRLMFLVLFHEHKSNIRLLFIRLELFSLLQIYGFSWVVLVGIVLVFKVWTFPDYLIILYFLFLWRAFFTMYILYQLSWLSCPLSFLTQPFFLGFWYFLALQIFTYSPKKSADFQLVLRFSQGVAAIGLVAAVCLVVAFTQLSIADLFASILAFIPTGWGILSVSFSFDLLLYEFSLNWINLGIIMSDNGWHTACNYQEGGFHGTLYFVVPLSHGLLRIIPHLSPSA